MRLDLLAFAASCLALAACNDCPTTDPGPPQHVDRPIAQCADIYDADIVPVFEIEIAQEELDAMGEEYRDWKARENAALPLKPYHPLLSFKYGDEVVHDASIRLKGNPCCSWDQDKMQFAISFNRNDPDARFHGLRKILLDAPDYDASLLRERVALSYLRELGVVAGCANHAQLYVNGDYYGLYVNVEAVDKEFLQRWFGDADEGNLYKYDWNDNAFELETNEDHGQTADLDALYAIHDIGDLERLMDVDQVISEWAAEAMMPQSDGYWAGSLNFYLYHHPVRGFMVIPWDLDNAFDRWPSDRKPHVREDHYGITFHFETVLAEPQYEKQWVRGVVDAHAAYRPDELISRTRAWAAQIAPMMVTDPNRGYTWDKHGSAVDVLVDYFTPRSDFVCEWIENRPERNPLPDLTD